MTFVALVMVLGLSGLPIGSMLCGLSCAPAEEAVTACHEHGAGTSETPVIDGLHLCDQDGESAPMIAQISSSTFADAPLLKTHQSVFIASAARSFSAHTLRPAPPPGALDTSASVLRI